MTRSDLPARDHHSLPDEIPEPGRIALSDLSDALTLGWRDFRRAPAFGEAAQSGTLSMPLPPQGWQRATRRTVSQRPRAAPCFSSASSA